MPTDPTLLEAHLTSDFQALNAIHATIDDENLQIISSCTTAYNAYQALCREHGDLGGISTATLFFELVNLRVMGDITIKEHIHQFQTIHNKLKGTIKNNKALMISDHFIAILLLFSLPSEYSPLVQTTLTTTAFDQIDLNNLYMLILVSHKVDPSTSSNSALLTVSDRGSDKSKQRGKKVHQPTGQSSSDPIKCSRGHVGHTDEKCRVQINKAKDKAINDLTARLEKLEKPRSDTARMETTSFYDEAFTTGPTNLSVITLDAGATSHMFGNPDLLQAITDITPSKINVAAKDSPIYAIGRGSSRIGRLQLSHVLYSPHLGGNLVSAGKLYDNGYDIEWRRTQALVKDSSGAVVLTFHRSPTGSRLWQIQVRSSPDASYFVASNADLWHQRLGHLHPAAVIRTLRAQGLPAVSLGDFSQCDGCNMGKATRSPSTRPLTRSTRILACVHSDLVGPISPSSLGGKKYFMTFIDDCTRYNCVYFLKSKDEAFSAFQHFQKWIEARTGEQILKLKSDRGGEYTSTAFEEYLHRHAIDAERGPAHRPTTNSVAERFNRTIISKMRAQLSQSGLPLYLWAELCLYTSLQINCSSTVSLDHRSPLESFRDHITSHQHPFNPKRLKPFGCLAYMYNRDHGKLEPTARRMIFVGLEPGSNAYRLWDKKTRKIVVSSDVTFDEQDFPAKHPEHSPSHQTISSAFPDDLFTPDVLRFPTVSPDTTPADPPSQSVGEVAPVEMSDDPPANPVMDTPLVEPSEEVEVVPPPVSVTRRSARVTAPPERYGFSAVSNDTNDGDNPTYEQALAGPDKELWLRAMEEEFQSLEEHHVGTLVDAPSDANILGGMWVLSRPRDEHHRIVKYKARWVIFGNHQIYGHDYLDTYASVGKSDSWRIILAIAISHRWYIMQFDIKTAFLNGDMIDTVHCRQVRGFRNRQHPTRVWLLNRSLYGSKQAARRWQQHFEGTIKEFGLTPADSDPAVYTLNTTDRGIIVVHLHVDDSHVFCSSPALLDEFRAFLDKAYTVKWTANPSLYLGINLTYDRISGVATITQRHYIESVLDRFSMTNCNSSKTPSQSNITLVSGTDEEKEAAKALPYQQLVGCLQWIALSTRPDIAYTVSRLSSFNSGWTQTHWLAAKHVLRYLKGTLHFGITYSANNPSPNIPDAWSDADFSQCPETRRSISGNLCRLNGGTVCWKSQKQSVVALSTAEAEYVSASEAVRQLLWVRSFLFDIFQQQTAPTTLYLDSSSAISIVEEDAIKPRSKHIDWRYHFIRLQHRAGTITIVHVPSEQMLADYLTKPLGKTGLAHALDLNGIVSLPGL